MAITKAGEPIKGETTEAYAMFVEFVDCRDLKEAYNNFMMHNGESLASLKMFIRCAHHNNWQERVNGIDAEEDLGVVRATRRAGIGNSLTAEDVAAELYKTCLEEFKLHQHELGHKEIAKYLEIANKINDRWVDKSKDAPSVVVNVGDNSTTTVEVPDEVLQRLGMEMAEEVEDD